MSKEDEKPTPPDYVPVCPGCKGPMWHQTSELQEGHGMAHYYTCPSSCYWRMCLLDPTHGTETDPNRGKWA